MKQTKIVAAFEGLIFGISMFFFVIDGKGGPQGMHSMSVYSHEAHAYHESSVSNDDDQLNDEVLRLSSVYEDFVGYLTVEGTSIEYPLMRDRTDSNGNYFYLSHDYRGEYDPCGCPFIRHSSNLDNDIVEVYAHNNSNGTMFADLSKFEDEEFFDEYGGVVIDTVDGRLSYRVIAVLDVSVVNGPFTFFGWSNFPSEEVEQEFIDQVCSLANQTSEEDISPGNQYLLLVTCEYSHSNGRRIVVAVRQNTAN
jgi:sortase B